MSETSMQVCGGIVFWDGEITSENALRQECAQSTWGKAGETLCLGWSRQLVEW